MSISLYFQGLAHVTSSRII